MTKGYVLAIDQGTTGSTVLVFDRECSIKGQAYSEITQHYPRPGWVEHNAEEKASFTFLICRTCYPEIRKLPLIPSSGVRRS